MHRSLTTSSLLLAISLVAACGGSQVVPSIGPGDSPGRRDTQGDGTGTDGHTGRDTHRVGGADHLGRAVPAAPTTSAPTPRLDGAHVPSGDGPGGSKRARMTIPRLGTHAILLGDAQGAGRRERRRGS